MPGVFPGVGLQEARPALVGRDHDASAAPRSAPDERQVTEVEINDRRTDARLDVEFMYASPELVERMAQALAAMSTENGTLTLAGLTFDVMLTEAELQPRFEGDTLKVRGRLRPARGATT